MKDKVPKLLADAMSGNDYDIDVITKHCKIPWLKLDIKFDVLTDDDIAELNSNINWRENWNYPTLEQDSYQVNGWNGDIFFGPKDWTRFFDLISQEQKYHDEDNKCRAQRQNLDYGWYVGEDHFLRQEIRKLFPNDEDINLVNTYSLQPGGFVFPHRDYASDGMGLAKIYIALKWSKDNVFGMYGCGNMPIEEGDVFLLNNYTLPHWVYNGSNDNRIVLDISANLHSPIIKNKIIESFKKLFAS
jgi:hypothetical protein